MDLVWQKDTQGYWTADYRGSTLSVVLLAGAGDGKRLMVFGFGKGQRIRITSPKRQPWTPPSLSQKKGPIERLEYIPGQPPSNGFRPARHLLFTGA